MMGMKKIPLKGMIARAYGMIPEWRLAKVHHTVIRGMGRDRWQETTPDFLT